MKFLSAGVCATALLGFASAAYADDIGLKDLPEPKSPVEYKVSGELIAGTGVRLENSDPNFIKGANAAQVGKTGNTNSGGGQNADDGNLNYKAGDIYSSAARAKLTFQMKYENFGAYVSAKAWYDYSLIHDDVPFGNLPNGLAANQPLGQKGLRNLAGFTGVELWDAYVTGKFDAGGMPLTVKAGNQRLPWGIQSSFFGGLGDINPVDYFAIFTPGATLDEYRIPIPAIYSTLGLTKELSVEGFYQFAHVQSNIIPCGTLFSTSDPFATGCNGVFVPFNLAVRNGVLQPDRTALANNLYFKREYRAFGEDQGEEYGGGARYKAAELNTEFGLFGANYRSRFPLGGVRKGLLGDGTLLTQYFAGLAAGNPLNANGPGSPTYAITYPDNIQVYAFNSVTQLPETKTQIAAEITYRPNLPIGLNSTDVQRAFAVPGNDPGNPLQTAAQGTKNGAFFAAYDRFDVTQVQASVTQPLPGVLGSAGEQVTAEVAGRFINDFTDAAVGTRRYGRSDTFNYGTRTNGTCPYDSAANFPKQGRRNNQCSFDGYVTDTSWGVRLRAGMLYKDQWTPGLDISPFVAYGLDIQGWSDDNTFNEGRNTAIVGVKAEYQKQYFAELAWRPNWGGDYNNTSDRDVFTVSGGYRFGDPTPLK